MNIYIYIKSYYIQSILITDLFIKYKKNVHTHTHILAGTQKDYSVAALAPQSHTDLYTYKHPCITYLQYLQYLQS